MASLILLVALLAQDAPRAGVAAWDTGSSATEPLSADALGKRSAWKTLESGASPQGDVVLTNGKILAVARKQGTGLEIYSLRTGSAIYRSRLLPAGNGTLEKISLPEIGRGGASIELTWKNASVRFRL